MNTKVFGEIIVQECACDFDVDEKDIYLSFSRKLRLQRKCYVFYTLPAKVIKAQQT